MTAHHAPSSFDGSELARLVSAIGTGIVLQYYLEPAAVDPELLPRALRQLFGYGPDNMPAPPRRQLGDAAG